MIAVWIALVWSAVAGLVGLGIGHVIHLRDRQVPRQDARVGKSENRHERTRT
jgi:hypothetical protein